MTPASHVLLLAGLQFCLGLVGLLTRRTGSVALASAGVMLAGALLGLCVLGGGQAEGAQTAGMVLLLALLSLAVVGGVVLYSFHRFRRDVALDEHDRMRR
jgi:NADH:ubiquinone oxidoreductase subunit K